MILTPGGGALAGAAIDQKRQWAGRPYLREIMKPDTFYED
jgi:hypothetical protein